MRWMAVCVALAAGCGSSAAEDAKASGAGPLSQDVGPSDAAEASGDLPTAGESDSGGSEGASSGDACGPFQQGCAGDGLLCTPGATTCLSGTHLQTCADDGLSYCVTACGSGSPCIGGACCAPQCEGKQCGDDGCGGQCGVCPIELTCAESRCIPVSCTGQEGSSFQRSLDPVPAPALPRPDGSWLAVGVSPSEAGVVTLVVTPVSSDGTPGTAISTPLSATGWPYDAARVAAAADGGFIAAFSVPAVGQKVGPPVLARFDAAGALAWEQDYAQPAVLEVAGLAAAPDGGAVIAGSTADLGVPDSKWRPRVLRASATGDPVWVAAPNVPGADHQSALGVVWSGDGVVLCGSGAGAPTHPWVARLGADGAQAWVVTLPDEDDGALRLAATGGAAVLAGSRSRVRQLDSMGALSWLADFGPDHEITALASLPSGSVVAGSTYGGTGDLWLARLDGSGQVLWDHTYGGPTSDHLLAAWPLANGGFALFGAQESAASLLVHTNPDGYAPPCQPPPPPG